MTFNPARDEPFSFEADLLATAAERWATLNACAEAFPELAGFLLAYANAQHPYSTDDANNAATIRDQADQIASRIEHDATYQPERTKP